MPDNPYKDITSIEDVRAINPEAAEALEGFPLALEDSLAVKVSKLIFDETPVLANQGNHSLEEIIGALCDVNRELACVHGSLMSVAFVKAGPEGTRLMVSDFNQGSYGSMSTALKGMMKVGEVFKRQMEGKGEGPLS